jgi:hypothetical protein
VLVDLVAIDRLHPSLGLVADWSQVGDVLTALSSGDSFPDRGGSSLPRTLASEPRGQGPWWPAGSCGLRAARRSVTRRGRYDQQQIQSIRFPSAGTAIVISKGAVVLAGEAEPRAENRALETWVLSQQDGTWRVKAFHNCAENAA